MFELTVDIPFSAAHQIRGHPGPCARLHGHNYRAVVAVTGERLNELGMLVDFGELKRVCGEAVASLDHQCLNELPPFATANPTAEAIARLLYQAIASRLPGLGPDLRLVRVTVYESDRTCASYWE